MLPLLGRKQCSHFLPCQLCYVDSLGTERKGPWELLVFLLLFCVRLQMKMCWKQCKSWVPQGRELWYTQALCQSTMQQPANASSIRYHLGTHFSVPSNGEIIAVRFLYFNQLFYSVTIATATCSTRLLTSSARCYLQFQRIRSQCFWSESSWNHTSFVHVFNILKMH